MQTNLYLVFLTLVSLIISSQTTIAQTYQPSNRSPVVDPTLGTQVSAGNNNFNITGGLNKGQTLFHSFRDFSIPTNGQANFSRPVGNRDIITRVTGGVFSDINGLVNTNGANFFLINPQGVVFGTNARLNVGKAFFATTANGIDLVDGGGKSYNFGVNGAGDAALLTVNPNVLFNPNKLIMGGSDSGSRGIVNYGTLQTSKESHISFIGGNVTLDGSDGGGKIVAPGGKIDLGGVNSAGTVTIDNGGLVFGNGLTFSDVSLVNGAETNVNNDSGNAGNIDIQARNLSLTNASRILAANNGTGNAGNVDIKTTGNITISGTNDPNLLTGDPDNSNSLSNIFVSTSGQGDPGQISIDAGGDLTITNRGGLLANINPKGNGNGNSQGIDIKAANISLTNISSIQAAAYGQGNGGSIKINTTGNLTISGTDNPKLITYEQRDPLSTILTQTDGKGDAGKIAIEAKGNVSINNRGTIFAGINNTGQGNSNGIEIRANNFSLTNFSNIYTANNGTGNSGNIDIKTKGNIIISGTEKIDFATKNDDDAVSVIDNNNNGKGDTGKIIIDAGGDLSIKNLGGIFAIITKDGIGNSKGIEIAARNVKLQNRGFVAANNDGGKGDTGDIKIQTTGVVDVLDASRISSKSIGVGKVNTISINANRINLNKGEISTNGGTVSGGDLFLTLNDLLLLINDSKISTNSESLDRKSSGGNITIGSPLIVALPGNNDITANAYNGTGGKVNITSQGLFGIQYRPKGQDSPFTNDITASSTFGQSGTVNINTPGTDPGKDIGELVAAPNDASNQISQACGASQRDNKLYITGRGGLPPNASEPLESEALWEDARAVQAKLITTNTPQRYAPPAIGWVLEQNGRVRLIAAQTGVGATGTRVICPNR
ncbi:S-layer family protein [Chamaesiphon sp. VAR_48_metabat_135_sub]|uniref:S-layer family protein n=1 Tax=Chamaesiphon sp. VAR_48_metabat_135_sub TaxID=2964699 RepID=UPI00286CCF91|nr:S-layer family protein [Chamaesiphon sp. VAR_48_metabat_135_sub]